MPQRRNLTNEQKELIKSLNAQGQSDKEIALVLGVHRTTVYRVLTPKAAAKNAAGDMRRRAEAKRRARLNTPYQYRVNLVNRARNRLARCEGWLERVDRGEVLSFEERDWLTGYTGGTHRTTRAKDRAVVDADQRLRRLERLERDGTLSMEDATWKATYSRQQDIQLLYGRRWKEAA